MTEELLKELNGIRIGLNSRLLSCPTDLTESLGGECVTEKFKQALRHADLRVTPRVYRHVLPSETRAFKTDFLEAAIPIRAVRETALY